jgi:hypothetical protein
VKRHGEKTNTQKPRDFYKYTKFLPGENRCMVVLALTCPKFTVVFFLWFTDIGEISVTGTVHVGHSSACRSTYMCLGT